MNQHPFTASLAAQHRAELMAAAQHARDYRLAKPARRRSFRIGLPHLAWHAGTPRTAPLQQLPDAR